MKGEFKIGDRVKVADIDKGAEHAVIGHAGSIIDVNRHSPWPILVEFDKHAEFYHSGHGLGKENHCYWCTKKMLQHEKSETIVIYRKGEEVIALDKSTGKTAKAICSPEDEFNFMTGAKLALERLEQKESPVQFLNGKVICVNSKNNSITRGKIYVFKNGRAVNDFGNLFPLSTPMKDIDELNLWMYSDFIEVKE